MYVRYIIEYNYTEHVHTPNSSPTVCCFEFFDSIVLWTVLYGINTLNIC